MKSVKQTVKQLTGKNGNQNGIELLSKTMKPLPVVCLVRVSVLFTPVE